MELIFIVILALIILGPKDMMKAGRTIGKFLRDLTRSEYYQAFLSSSREIRNLPTRLIREANLEEEIREVDRTGRNAGSFSANTIHPPPETAETEQPPAQVGAADVGAGLRPAPNTQGPSEDNPQD